MKTWRTLWSSRTLARWSRTPDRRSSPRIASREDELGHLTGGATFVAFARSFVVFERRGSHLETADERVDDVSHSRVARGTVVIPAEPADDVLLLGSTRVHETRPEDGKCGRDEIYVRVRRGHAVVRLGEAVQQREAAP